MSQRKLHYLLLDSAGDPVAKGLLESPPTWEALQVRVLDDMVNEVLDHELLQLVGMSEGAPNLLGRIENRRGDVIVLTKIKALGAEARRNLRMPVVFSGFLHPRSGKWKGRRAMESIDLSCGGIAFYCNEELAVGEDLDAVVPVKPEPLVLQCKVLRKWQTPARAEPAYAVKFVQTCHDEEVLLREAVFNLQLQNRNVRAKVHP